MPVTIDGTTGVTTPGATVGSITGILKATSGVVSQAVAGTDYLTSSSGGAITLATAQTATGTAIDFTGIPSWAKRITVMFNGVSVSGTSNILVRLGYGSTTYETAGYSGGGGYNINNSTTGNFANSVGFNLVGSSSQAAALVSGTATLTNITGSTWVCSSIMGSSSLLLSAYGGGNIVITSALTAVRITTVNGTDTFDAGTINISYE